AKKGGVKRFVFASSCSVYGQSILEELDEESALNPVSKYAESKVKAETELLEMSDDKFAPVSLRQATLFGVSPRMRFDLAINLMVMHALTKKKVFVWGGGKQWRPFLHVRDSADAFVKCLEVSLEKISGQIFNVSNAGGNYQIIKLAKIVKDCLPGTSLEIIPENPDKRSYRVISEKIRGTLGWEANISAEEGIEELSKFLSGNKDRDFNKITYFNIETIKRYLEQPAIEDGDPVRGVFLPFALPQIGIEEENEVINTLRSGWITTGPKTQRFEKMICDYTQSKYAVALNSCTAALHLSLVALGIQQGDEVITSPITWPATANVIIHVGAKPVFVDVDRNTLNIDTKKIEEKISKRTKAIIPVHMAGRPCDLDKIHAIAKKHNLYVIEDAAHAIGAEYNGRKIGSLSDFTCFSFYPIKAMTTIEGGIVTTQNKEWMENIKINSLHGVDLDAWKRYTSSGKKHHEVIMPGYKYNMTDIQASLGIHQLLKLDRFLQKREEYVRIYDEAFLDIPEIEIPKIGKGVKSAHLLYIIMIKPELLKRDRDYFVDALKKENIGTGIHFISLHLQKYYKDTFGFGDDDFPNSKYISDRIISLPLYPKMTYHDIDCIIKAVKKLVKYYKV
ncbi:MAG: aminotransferase class I/II-fold pyridoxal phosphate-dependent enzyme, partial [Thermodesulfobacteriota bacterium]